MEISTPLNGYRTHAFYSREEFLDYIDGKKKILIAINAEKLLRRDIKLRNITKRNIGYADGIGAVIALRQKGFSAVKIPGAEFWLDIIERYQKSKTFYFVGATQEVIEKTVKDLKHRYSDIKIVGYRNGYITSDKEYETLCQSIIKASPDIVYVAMGSPKQEYLMNDLYNKYPALYMGLGGSFDVFSGIKKRAPKLFLFLWLEWFYRLVSEPTRFKRQKALIKFLFLYTLRRL